MSINLEVPEEVRDAGEPGASGRDRDVPPDLAQVRPGRARVPEGTRHARRGHRRHERGRRGRHRRSRRAARPGGPPGSGGSAEQGQPQRHQHVLGALDHGGVLGRRRDGAVDAAAGPRRRCDRLGRQRRATRPLRQAVGVDGDHRAGLRLRLGGGDRPLPSGTATTTSSTARRSTSRQADARTPSSCGPRSTSRRAAPRSSRSSSRRARRAWSSSGSSTSSASARPTPRRSASPTAACPPRTCSARPRSRPSRASPASCRPSTTPVRSWPAWRSGARAQRSTRSRICCVTRASRSTTTGRPPRQSAAAATYLQMEADWEAAYLLTLEATWMADNRKPNSLQASMAKAKAGRTGGRHHAALRRAGRRRRLQRELAAREVGARLEDPRHLRGHPADPAADRRASPARTRAPQS